MWQGTLWNWNCLKILAKIQIPPPPKFSFYLVAACCLLQRTTSLLFNWLIFPNMFRKLVPKVSKAVASVVIVVGNKNLYCTFKKKHRSNNPLVSIFIQAAFRLYRLPRTTTGNSPCITWRNMYIKRNYWTKKRKLKL